MTRVTTVFCKYSNLKTWRKKWSATYPSIILPKYTISWNIIHIYIYLYTDTHTCTHSMDSDGKRASSQLEPQDPIGWPGSYRLPLISESPSQVLLWCVRGTCTAQQHWHCKFRVSIWLSLYSTNSLGLGVRRKRSFMSCLTRQESLTNRSREQANQLFGLMIASKVCKTKRKPANFVLDNWQPDGTHVNDMIHHKGHPNPSF